jgi:ABC-2 type transport system permease protein
VANREDSFDVGLSQELSEELVQSIEAIGEPLDAEVKVERLAAEDAETRVADGDVDLAVLSDRLLVREPVNPDSTGGTAQFVRLVEGVVRLQLSLAAEGLDPRASARALFAPPLPIDALEPDEATDAERSGATFAAIASFFLIQWFSNSAGHSVAEEKESRLVEVLLLGTPPRSILGGKLLGIGAVGLVQVTVIVLVTLVSQAVMSGSSPMSDIAADGLFLAAGWFALGYLLFGSIMTAVGSLVTRRQEFGGAGVPVQMVLITGYVLANIAVSEGDHTLATVLALVPFTAPTAAPALMAVGDLSSGVIAASFTLALLTGAACLAVAARVYERGITETGRRVRFREALRLRRVAATATTT